MRTPHIPCMILFQMSEHTAKATKIKVEGKKNKIDKDISKKTMEKGEKMQTRQTKSPRIFTHCYFLQNYIKTYGDFMISFQECYKYVLHRKTLYMEIYEEFKAFQFPILKL